MIRKPEHSEPEEWRKLEADSQKLSAEIAEKMIRFPRWRWFLGRLRRVLKWIEKECDEALKEDGWR